MIELSPDSGAGVRVTPSASLPSITLISPDGAEPWRALLSGDVRPVESEVPDCNGLFPAGWSEVPSPIDDVLP